MAPVIHFVNETGQGQKAPSKQRISRINAHVARFSHDRRRKLVEPTGSEVPRSNLPSPPQAEFILDLYVAQARPVENASTCDGTRTEVSGVYTHRTSPAEGHPSSPPGLPALDHSDRVTPKFQLGHIEPKQHPKDATSTPCSTERNQSAKAELLTRHFHGISLMFSIDSVFELGNSVTLYERSLLRYYFSHMATEMFGFEKDALYCPTRVPASRSIQRSRGALHWILVTAEEHISKRANNNIMQLNLSIPRRRAAGYRVLRALLSADSFDLEHTVTALRYATVAECYANNPDAAQEHVRGFDTILQQPGALEYFVTNMETTALSLSSLKKVYICAPCKIKPLEEFKSIRTSVFQSLRYLQSSARQSDTDRRYSARESEHSASSINLFCRFIQTKKSTLLSVQASMAVKRALDPGWKFPFQAGLFALLYDLNMTLASFPASHLGEKIEFLEKLQSVIESSSSTALGPSSVLAMVDWAREQFYSQCFQKDESTSKELGLCSDEINALKLFALLDFDNRTRLTTVLRAWLLNDICPDVDNDKDFLRAEDFLSMKTQVTRRWWAENETLSASASC